MIMAVQDNPISLISVPKKRICEFLLVRPQSRRFKSQTAGIQSLWLDNRLKAVLVESLVGISWLPDVIGQSTVLYLALGIPHNR